MLEIVLALVSEIIAAAPKMIAAGLSVADLLSKAQEALKATNRPDNAQWVAADVQVKALMDRAMDPATDDLPQAAAVDTTKDTFVPSPKTKIVNQDKNE